MRPISLQGWILPVLISLLLFGLFPAPSFGEAVAPPAASPWNAPVIKQLAPQTVPNDLSAWIDFEVSDPDTPLSQLTVRATSNRSDEELEVEITEKRQSVLVRKVQGSFQVTIEVTDGHSPTRMEFWVTSSGETNVLTTGPWDLESGHTMQGVFARYPGASPSDLDYSVTTSDPRLSAGLHIDSTGRFGLTLTAQEGLFGMVNVDLLISEGRRFIEYTLPIRVYGRPIIQPIADRTIDPDTTLTIPVYLSDPDTPVEELRVFTGYNVQGIIDGSSLHLAVTGEGAERTLTISPPPNYAGPMKVQVHVSDGFSDAEAWFTLTVKERPPTGPPFSFGAIADVTIPEDYSVPTLLGGRRTRTSLDVPLPIEVHYGDHGEWLTNMDVSLSDRSLFAGYGWGVAGYDQNDQPLWKAHLVTKKDRFGSTQVTVVARKGEFSITQTFTVTVAPVNDPPTFQAGPDQVVENSAGPQVKAGWAKDLSPGPYEEGQELTFQVTTVSSDLFTTAPAISPDGTLTYTPAPGKTGTANITVTLKDNGGTERDGQDTSLPSTFTITVTDSPAPAPAVQNTVTPNPSAKGPALYADLPPTHWAYETIQYLAEQQVVTGLAADHFAPDVAVTRETFASWLVQAFHLAEDPTLVRQFLDVPEESLLAGAIGGAVKAGFMLGDAGGTFRPEAPVSRQELALILVRVLQRHATEVHASDIGAATFATLQDQTSISPWALEGVRFVVERGLITGRPGPIFAPGEKTTRAEAATVIHRMLELVGP